MVEMTINGVLYYGAHTGRFRLVLMCFDLSSEEFNVIALPDKSNNIHLSYVTLMNYKGKVAFLDYDRVLRQDTVDVWVLENAEKS